MSPSSTSPSKRRHSPSLSLDLSELPALSQPSPPTNTLIITNLSDPLIFTADNLASIKSALDTHAPLYSFSPLKSFRRIIASFYSIDAAIDIRSKLDGETVLGQRIRVYFGSETKITNPQDIHLKAPSTGKLFFISPPPSPPHGWESRHEDPPNKEVHADDLAAALHRLSADPSGAEEESDVAEHVESLDVKGENNRRRADSRTIVYHPVEQGHSPDLPAIAVEDTSAEASPVVEEFGADPEGVGAAARPITHTARPPVELME